MNNREAFIEAFRLLDHEIVQEIINVFIVEYPERIKTIQNCIEKNDSAELQFHSHSFKGVASHFRDEALIAMIKTLEEKGKNGNLEGAQALLSEITIASDQLIADLKTLKDSVFS